MYGIANIHNVWGTLTPGEQVSVGSCQKLDVRPSSNCVDIRNNLQKATLFFFFAFFMLFFFLFFFSFIFREIGMCFSFAVKTFCVKVLLKLRHTVPSSLGFNNVWTGYVGHSLITLSISLFNFRIYI